ncbi:MAG: hypothetical protein ACRD8U_20045 [Pyrinomonadaceae bacterium]
MICFQIDVNNETVCTAGIGEFGVLTATISWVQNRDQTSKNRRQVLGIALNVGGLTDHASGEDEFMEWIKKRLSVGDEVRLRIVEAAECDEPSERSRRDPHEQVDKAREYYEEIRLESQKK